jgi:hypothetical protein
MKIAQRVVAGTAVIMGTSIGALTVGLGLGLMGSPWELHFAAHHVAAAAMTLVGLSVVAIGAILLIDLIDGGPTLHHRH